MCGLCGLAFHERERRFDESALVAMTDALAHRGPDDRGTLIWPGAALGFRRLSIIDVAVGHQPMLIECGDLAEGIIGAFYTPRAQRARLCARGHVFRTQADTEAVVHLYEERGEHFVEDLVGMFAVAIVDRRGGGLRLVLARDRLGIKPLYFAEARAGITFASEPKALLELGWTGRELVGRALLDYLVQGYVGGPASAWSGIARLPPGHVLTWEPGARARTRRYWDLPLEVRDEPVRSAEVLEWLDRCVADHLMSDVPLGAFLSGGIDSNAVVTSMARALGAPPIVCSVGFRERSHDELELARATALQLGAARHEEILEPDPTPAAEILPWFFDEPHADPSNVPTWLVSRMAREHVTVALSGDGGDELFAGYRRYVHDVAEQRVRRLAGSAGRALLRGAGRSYPRLDWAPRFLRAKTFLTNAGDAAARAYWRSVTRLERADALALLAPELARALAAHDPFERFEEHYRAPRRADALYRAQYADFHTNLPDQILAKVDRASMAVSLEVRPPLLDHRFVERFAPLRAREKVRRGRGKVALREALRGRVRAEVLDGAKRGFDTPIAAWIRGPLRARVAAALADLPSEWFQRAALERALSEHLAHARNHDRLLWSLFVLAHWRVRHRVTGLSA
jgi:asparagine synthase (glutamine-hydrolysing)